MSIKSLLQIILFMLIILIVGGIYFVYFYSKPLNNELTMSKNLNEIGVKTIDKNTSLDQELLENTKVLENNVLKTDAKLKEKNFKQTDKSVKTKLSEENKPEIENVENQKLQKKNISKNIEYITTNKDGEIFKILAAYGRTNLKNSNILDLEIVNGELITTEELKIFIKSDYAKYDYNDQNSKFYGNVKINYDNKEITCDNLDLNINDNIAVAYNNVIMTEENSQMKAENVIMDLVTKDININSKNKLELSKN